MDLQMYREVTPVKVLRSNHERKLLAAELFALRLKQEVLQANIANINREMNQLPVKSGRFLVRSKVLKKWQETWDRQEARIKAIKVEMEQNKKEVVFGS